jgi:hypothetical protein
MPALNAVNKLNRLVDLFTKGDNAKLDRAETDAIAGYYSGLPEAGKAKVKDRLIEVYQTSTFARGQKSHFMDLLVRSGISIEELEGVKGDTGAGILRMSKAAQLETVSRFYVGEGGGEEGFSKDVRPSDVARDASAKIKTALSKHEKDMLRDHGDETSVTPQTWQAIYREEDSRGRGKELLGYAVEVGVYTGDHDVDEVLFFNIKGEHLGTEYIGE